MSYGRDYAVGLLTAQTERDLQVKVGASNMSNSCSRCLARDLAGSLEGNENRAYLGAKWGNAMHMYLEHLQEGSGRTDLLIEEKIHLGHLDGYGDIGSRPDAALLDNGLLIDWKSSLREKSKAMQQFLGMPVSRALTAKDKLEAGAAKIRAYIAQTQVYAKGLNDAGYKIDQIEVVVLNRDGTGWFDHPEYEDYENYNKQRDIWSFEIPYRESYAQQVWDRMAGIWTDLQSGREIDDFARAESCWRDDRIAEQRLIDNAEKVG